MSLKDSLLREQEVVKDLNPQTVYDVPGHGSGRSPLHEDSFILYRGRWWVLTCFSAFAFLQGGLWAIPGPLSSTYSNDATYGFDTNSILLLVNYGPIFYIPFALPMALWMDKPGALRSAVLSCHILVSVGAALRVWAAVSSLERPFALALIHISYILNAIAGPVAMGAVGKISELWFPVHFRGTATAIMSEANMFGGAFAFLVGPAMVPDQSLQQLQSFNWLCLILCLAALIGMTVHFPSQPSTPPSRSAAELRARDDANGFTLAAFKTALTALVKKRSFVVLICAYGFACGMFASWSTMLSVNLSEYSPAIVGYLSFTSCLAGNVGGVVLGRYIDRFRNMKIVLVLLMAVAGASFTAFATIAALPPNGNTTLILLFITGAVGGLALNSAIPVFFELSMEISFPHPEGTVITVLTLMNNVGCLLFLGVPVGQAGTLWMDWLFAGTVCVAALALALFFKEESLRYDVDADTSASGTTLAAAKGVEGEDESGSDHILLLDSGGRGRSERSIGLVP